MQALQKGRYGARPAQTAQDLHCAQALRTLSFRAAPDALADADAFDALCTHMLIEDMASGTLVCCYRLLPLTSGAGIARSYSAQFYDLTALAAYPGAMVEMGRFCIHPDWHDPDILRIAWGAATRAVDSQGVTMLFGCASFHGTDPAAHRDAFALLRNGHLAPAHWQPRRKAPEVIDFAATPATPIPRRAQLSLPPLLRTYLAMGGWVSDHAVIDRDMQTIHVFTGLEISAIPPARARLLRAIAQ